MNKYQDLFAQISKTTRSLAEQVADYDKTANDTNGADAALTMRDDFDRLALKLENNMNTLTKDDYVKLLLGTMIVVNNLEDRKEMLDKAINNYRVDVMPKLERIVNEGNNENLKSLVKELFDTET